MTDCDICCEEFNNSTRKSITCPNASCNLNSCKTCIKTYLLNTADKPHCMKCKHSWDRGFNVKHLKQGWIEGDYKKHRKEILFQIEKARLPETVPFVQAKRTLTQKEISLSKQRDLVNTLRDQLQAAQNEEYRMRNEIKRIKNGGIATDKEKKVFMRRCCVEECKGFLSAAWKCGVCEIFSCKNCLAPIGEKKDDEHVCNENAVKTAALLKKETRNCPSCAVTIYKISGCDQMWCTQCHIAFSWRTGLKVTGTIHNPHYYEAQRNGVIATVNNPGAVACGGIPEYYRFRQILNSHFDKSVWCQQVANPTSNYPSIYMWKQTHEIIKHLEKIHRGINHFQHVVIDPMRQKVQQIMDNKDLRIKYLMNECDEKNFKKNIARRDKAHEKIQQQLHVYELMNTVSTERLVALFNNFNIENIVETIMSLERVREYCNDQLRNLGRNYKLQALCIKSNYYTSNYNAGLRHGTVVEVPTPPADNQKNLSIHGGLWICIRGNRGLNRRF
jgi:hypothetical protein